MFPRTPLTFLALLFGALLAGAAAGAGEPAGRGLDAVIARGVLRVGTTGDYRPFSYADPETRNFQGIDIDMAKALATALGVKLELVRTSWPTLTADLLADKFDVAMGGVSVSAERQKAGLFSIPYLIDGKTPIARCAEQTKYRDLAQIDRPGVRVIVNPGGTNERFARAHLTHAAIEVFPDNVAIFDRIAAGKADVMITDGSEARLQHKLHPSLCPTNPDHPFDTVEKAYLLPRDAALKAAIDRWLHQALITKQYQEIADKWLN